MKAVIDTNIWISFLIGKLLAGLDDYILDGLLEVVISDEQMEEIKVENYCQTANVIMTNAQVA